MGFGSALPPIVQEYRANYKDVIDGHQKIKASQRDMVDDTDRQSSRMGRAFGGAAKVAAGAAIAVAAAAVAGIAAIVKVGIQEAKDASAVNAQLEAGLRSTKNAANVTVDGMNALAKSIQAFSGQTDDSIAGAESLLLTFTNIRNVGADKIFDQTTLAAANMAAKLGGDAASQAMLLGKALNDPISGVTKLTRAGVQFTDAQKAQIKAMQEAGNMVGAQKIILGELETQFGGAAEAAGKSLPGSLARAKRAFEDLSQGVVEKFLPIVTPAIAAVVDKLQVLAPVAENIAGRVANALTKIPDAINIVKGAISGLGSGVDLGPLTGPLEAFGGILKQIGDAAAPIIAQIKGAFDQLAPVFAPLIGQVIELWTSFSPLMLIFKAIAPVLPVLIGALVDLATSIGAALGGALTQILPIVAEVAGLLSGELAKIVQMLAPIVAELAKSLGGLLGKAISALMPIIVKLAEFAGKLLEQLLPLIDPVLQLVMAFIPLLDPIMELVGSLLEPLIDLLGAILDPVMQLVEAFVGFLVPAISAVIDILIDILMPIIKMVTDVLGGLIDFIVGIFSGNWEKAWGGIVKVFTGIFEGIKGVVKAVLNTAIDYVNGIIKGINTITGSISDATNGAIDIKIGTIPKVSFDVGTDRVPGPTGAPVPATVHGGEAVLSNAMLAGKAAIPKRVVDAVAAQAQPASATGTSEGGDTYDIDVNVTTNASAKKIAAELGWVLRRKG